MNMVLDDYDGHMISGDKCGLHFLTFALRLKKNTEKPQPGNWPDQGSNPGWVRGNDVTPRPKRCS